MSKLRCANTTVQYSIWHIGRQECATVIYLTLLAQHTSLQYILALQCAIYFIVVQLIGTVQDRDTKQYIMAQCKMDVQQYSKFCIPHSAPEICICVHLTWHVCAPHLAYMCVNLTWHVHMCRSRPPPCTQLAHCMKASTLQACKPHPAFSELHRTPAHTGLQVRGRLSG